MLAHQGSAARVAFCGLTENPPSPETKAIVCPSPISISDDVLRIVWLAKLLIKCVRE
jgi:hypothetical protein